MLRGGMAGRGGQGMRDHCPTMPTFPMALTPLTWQRYPAGWATQVAPCWQGLDWHGFTLSWHRLPWNPGGQ